MDLPFCIRIVDRNHIESHIAMIILRILAQIIACRLADGSLLVWRYRFFCISTIMSGTIFYFDKDDRAMIICNEINLSPLAIVEIMIQNPYAVLLQISRCKLLVLLSFSSKVRQ